VLQAGRRILVVDADVLQGEKLMARAQGTFTVL
jgi:acyl-coenzyme A thioesterase PaaI-like protein